MAKVITPELLTLNKTKILLIISSSLLNIKKLFYLLENYHVTIRSDLLNPTVNILMVFDPISVFENLFICHYMSRWMMDLKKRTWTELTNMAISFDLLAILMWQFPMIILRVNMYVGTSCFKKDITNSEVYSENPINDLRWSFLQI